MLRSLLPSLYQCGLSRSTTAGGVCRRWVTTGARINIDFPSLQRFFDLHGHISVPHDFAFPPNEPGVGRQAHRLGLHVRDIRSIMRNKHKYFEEEQLARLKQLRFNLFARSCAAERTILALETYKKVKNIPSDQRFTVPCKFKVPVKDPKWPKAVWGLRLGNRVSAIRCAGSFAPYHQRFVDLNLKLKENEESDVKEQLRSYKFEKLVNNVLLALETYKKVNNIPSNEKFQVPRRFKVPVDDPAWPEEVWGLPLGARVSIIRYASAFVPYHQRFIDLNLKLKENEESNVKEYLSSYNFEKQVKNSLLALDTYKKVNNIPSNELFKVPLRFKVPVDDPAWPREVWGLPLGVILFRVRCLGTYAKYRQSFIDRNLDMRVTKKFQVPSNPAEGLSPDLPHRELQVKGVLLALETYKKVNNIMPDQTFSVPREFKIPEGDSAWPRSVWGLRLGRTLYNVRVGGLYSKYHQSFVDLNFDMSVKRALSSAKHG